MTLEELKNLRYHDIDSMTRYIIEQGFAFDSNQFSLSYNAQINWTNLPLIPDNLFPLPISTHAETIYMLSLANKMNFYLTAVNAKTTPLFSGSALKSQIHDCVDEACVNAVVDNRLP